MLWPRCNQTWRWSEMMLTNGIVWTRKPCCCMCLGRGQLVMWLMHDSHWTATRTVTWGLYLGKVLLWAKWQQANISAAIIRSDDVKINTLQTDLLVMLIEIAASPVQRGSKSSMPMSFLCKGGYEASKMILSEKKNELQSSVKLWWCSGLEQNDMHSCFKGITAAVRTQKWATVTLLQLHVANNYIYILKLYFEIYQSTYSCNRLQTSLSSFCHCFH